MMRKKCVSDQTFTTRTRTVEEPSIFQVTSPVHCKKTQLWETKKASLLLTFLRTSAVKGCDVVVCDLFSCPDGNRSPNLYVEIVMDDVPVTS